VPDHGPGLLTIGHSNQALDAFLGLLRQHSIEAVADVRTVPWSRYVPVFNAKRLHETLAEHGIDYVPLGAELGGRPAGEEFYDEQGHVLYGRLAASPAFQQGIDRVLRGARSHRIALLCSEENPSRYHRHLLIGRVLRTRGDALPRQGRWAHRNRGRTGGQGGQRRPAAQPLRRRRRDGSRARLIRKWVSYRACGSSRRSAAEPGGGEAAGQAAGSRVTL
jgi:hypothetical protein